MDSIGQLEQAERHGSVPLLEAIIGNPTHPVHIRCAAAVSISHLVPLDLAIDLLKHALTLTASSKVKMRLAECFYAAGDTRAAVEAAPEGEFKGHLFRARVLLEIGIGGNLLEKEIAAAQSLQKISPVPDMIRAQARLAGILEFSIEQAANELSRALMLSSKAPDPLEDQDKLKCMVDLAHCYAHPALKQYEKCVNLATSIIQLLQRVKAKTMQSGITVTDIERKMIELLDRNKFVIPEMLFLRAGSNFELKKFKDALSDFVELEHALAVKSDMRIPSAQKKLIKLKKAMCFAQLGEFANAIDESTVYLKSVDHDLEIHDSDLLMKALDVRGTCYYRTLQLGKALEDFKAACSIRPLRQDIYEKFVRVSNINGDEIEKIGSNIKESFSGRSGVIDVKMIEEAKAMVYPLALHIFSNKDKSTTAEAEALVNQSVTSIIQEVKKIAELNSKKAEKKTN